MAISLKVKMIYLKTMSYGTRNRDKASVEENQLK